MLGAMNAEIARLRRAELRERACRDRQGRVALAAAGTRRVWTLPRRRRAGDLPCETC
jgi:hypothetical protein